jgi:hypothetical protein
LLFGVGLAMHTHAFTSPQEKDAMRPTVYLRIASVLTFIHAALHTIGGVLGKPPNATAVTVAATMRMRFPVFGVMRSYSDFLLGMGIAASISLTMEAICFWILASMAESNAQRLRPLLAVFLLGYVALAVNSYLFFFAGPVIAELLIVFCIAMAIFSASSTSDQPERMKQSQAEGMKHG